VKRRVAVIGSGIAGLAVAHALADEAHVTLFEAGGHFGGHTNTVDVTLDGIAQGVDTGFLVFNERTYPALMRLFDQLGVPRWPAEMSFSVQAGGLEWSGRNLGAVFAQRANLLRPRFWHLLAELLRFNRLARALARGADETALDEALGDFLQRHRFGEAFRDGYLLPMLGCIWSCPTAQALRFPLGTMLRFCDNHGLLQVADRPRWFSVPGGAQQYVRKMLARVGDARLRTPVQWARRLDVDPRSRGTAPTPPGGPVPAWGGPAPGLGAGSVIVHSAGHDERFDELVLACHSDQSLALLIDASARERVLLGAIGYQANRAVLHTDASLLPRHRRAWAAWNYERAVDASREQVAVCVHYLLNRLQPLPWARPLIVSLNPARAPVAQTVIAEFDYAHPLFDAAAITAQRALPQLQGRAHTWFCGAWTRHGFHEDGLVSALSVVEGLRQRWRAQADMTRAAA
jgi:predicted NAD/FAD-binding protein